MSQSELIERLETLLSEGLDLCVRARKIDDGLSEQAIRERFPDSAAMYPEHYNRSLTPYLWVQEQYDKDLADWEKRCRDFLVSRALDPSIGVLCQKDEGECF